MVAVDILLSTYNGSRYLRDQIDSVIAQSYKNWHLWVRDDGSDDESESLLLKYQELLPAQITIVSDSLGRLGPAHSFEQLMLRSRAPYVAFCDQDDIWLPHKLRLQMHAIRDARCASSIDYPVLVHSDLQVVNMDLELLADSFWAYQNLNPKKMNNLRCLLTQNFVTGCSVLANRKLVELALPFPYAVIMHDWWLALLACSNGQIIDLNEKTVLYRQHGGNDTGAKKWGLSYIVEKLRQGSSVQKESLLRTCHQAKVLLASSRLSINDVLIVEEYINMFEMDWFRRRVMMLRMGFFKHGLLRKIAMLILI